MKLSAERKHSIQRLLAAIVSLTPIAETVQRLVGCGVVPASVWFRLPVNKQFRVKVSGKTSFVYEAVPADAVGRRLFWRGSDGYEPETTRVFEALASRSRVTLDIGANTGYFSLIAAIANEDGRVFAFEPVPRNYERLKRNSELNQLGGRFEALQMAVSDTSGFTSFHVPHDALPHSGSLNVSGFRGLDGNTIRVETRTIDELSAKIGEVDLVKIDVEGFELNVLRGMKKTLNRFHPSIIFECLGNESNDQIETMLRKLGYRMYRLSQEGLSPMSKVLFDLDHHNRNVLAVEGDVSLERLGEWRRGGSRVADEGSHS